MSSPRWLIGLLMVFVLLTIVSNIVEQADMLTAAQVAEVQEMTTQQLTGGKDPDTGGVITAGNNPLTVWQSIWKALTSEYSFWYKIDCTLTESECASAATYGVTGKWINSTDCCQIPNAWSIIRYVIFWPITVAMFVEIALVIRRFYGF